MVRKDTRHLSEVWFTYRGLSTLILKMQTFDKYISRSRIILHLCRIRARYAQQRSKNHLIHLLTEDPKHNYHLNSKNNYKEISDEVSFLNSIFPSRRKWKTLNKNLRYKENGQRINSVDYNKESLLLTINYYERNFPEEPFLVNLNKFVQDIQDSIDDPDYIIETPYILPKVKGITRKDKNKCRPISLFSLKDKLIICLTNKYFTDVFDKFFYSGSYAFRAIQTEGEKRFAISHHDAVQSIQAYKNNYKGKRLWVSECDISKFYDSVHHSIVKKHFRLLINRLKKESPELYDYRAERIFYKYLESYSFVKNVLPFNKDSKKKEEYWSNKKIPGGYFGWVEDDLIKLEYFKNIRNAKIGVPQGGALSGLIANIVLNYADRKVVQSIDPKLLYLRFCDDMIIIHPSKNKCKEFSQIYYKSLTELHLVPHEFTPINNDSRESLLKFWSSDFKSKDPYSWSLVCRNSFPWFGFVGYEIHYSGNLRVRKSSLIKEKKKQKDTVLQIISAVQKGQRKSLNTIYESAVNRLIGMSVGRLKLSNFERIENEMCWKHGFKNLADNDHLRTQLKELDRYRAKQLSTLLKSVNNLKVPRFAANKRKIKENEFARITGLSEKDSQEIRNQLVISEILNVNFQINDNVDFESLSFELGLSPKYSKYKNEIILILKSSIEKRDEIYYGKPFSYYYQIIERR